jgi:glycosyltransferase involved in cell wall biosynthesis
VTITFNDPDGLKRTLDSLPSEGFEWIVIDGTTQPDVINENKRLLISANVKLLQEPDKGRFDAMNKGLHLATGEIICFLNSGDAFCSKIVIRDVLSSYLSNQWHWAVGDTLAIDKFGNKLWAWPMPKHHSLKLRLGINSYCHQATFVKTNLLRQFGGFETHSLYSDWLISLQLSKKVRPFMLKFLTTFFLTDGISSKQTISYWKNESCRLREKHDVKIFNSTVIDSFLQNIAAKFISSTRGKLIRPDLSEKYHS